MSKPEITGPLGKITPYSDQYDPSLLFPIPRLTKRLEINVPMLLPFEGVDIWNAYEISWLNPKGKPEVAIGEFIIPCTSLHIIESKSFKLYLNSFNQTCFDNQLAVEKIILQDLSAATGDKDHVKVTLTPPANFDQVKIQELSGDNIDDLDVTCDSYFPQPAYLTTEKNEVEESLTSNLLKSNCLVTGQPDWASVTIHYIGKKIDRAGLLKYIVSFRNHNEFHEQCVERIFMDIVKHCAPQKLTVYARYTRRGGLDINPFRSNFEKPPPNIRTARQ